MSTSTQPLKYLWKAYFSDGKVIEQPADDRYSKHDDSAEHNPSAFRDVLDYPSHLMGFALGDWAVDVDGGFFIYEDGKEGIRTFSLEVEPLTDRKLIYYREMHQLFNTDGEAGEPFVNRYVLGYEGKDKDGKKSKKVIVIA